jgi:hypothetical protein
MIKYCKRCERPILGGNFCSLCLQDRLDYFENMVQELFEENNITTAVDEKTTECDRCDTFENPSCNRCLGV